MSGSATFFVYVLSQPGHCIGFAVFWPGLSSSTSEPNRPFPRYLQDDNRCYIPIVAVQGFWIYRWMVYSMVDEPVVPDMQDMSCHSGVFHYTSP